MEIREVADNPDSVRTFRDNLKAWKNRGSDAEVSAEDEARAENEGMLAPEDAPEPVIVEEDALDKLEADVLASEAESKKRSR